MACHVRAGGHLGDPVEDRARTTPVTAQTRQARGQRAAKKTAAKRADPYAAARGIPEANRKLAAKRAAAPKKQVAVRKANGQFDGSKVMPDRDRAAWQSALGGAVDPALLPRSARTRRR